MFPQAQAAAAAFQQPQAAAAEAAAERLAVAAGASTLVTRINDDQHRIRVAFHPTANIIAFGGSDPGVQIWRFKRKDGETSQLLTRASKLDKYHETIPYPQPPIEYHHTSDITAIVFDPKHPIMITGSKYTEEDDRGDEVLKLWLMKEDGTKIYRCVTLNRESDVTDEGVLCIAVHPTLPVFIVGYTNKKVAFYHYKYQSTLAITISPPKIYSAEDKIFSDVTSVAFHPSEPFLVVGTQTGQMTMFKFDPDSPDTAMVEVQMFVFHKDQKPPHHSSIKSLAFHNNLPYILSQEYDGRMCLWSYSLNEIDQQNEFRFGPEYRSTTKRVGCYAAAFHPTKALIMSATRTYVELYGFNHKNGLSFNNDEKNLTPLPIIMSPIQLRRDEAGRVLGRELTFTVGFHPSLDYCFTSYDNELYIYNTSEVSKKAYNLRTMAGKGPNAAILYNEMGAQSGIKRSSSAPPRAGVVVGNGEELPWKHLTNPGSMVGPIIAMLPQTDKLPKKQLTVVEGATDVKRTKSAGKGRRKTSRSVKKIVRKTKKYRKHRITYRRRK